MRKLDSLGYIHWRCGFLTDSEIMNRIKNHIELPDSISETKRIEYDASDEKKDEHETKMIELKPKTSIMLTRMDILLVPILVNSLPVGILQRDPFFLTFGWFTTIQSKIPMKINTT